MTYFIKNTLKVGLSAFLILTINSCENNSKKMEQTSEIKNGKPVVYQVMTRLFGNTNNTNKPWGTKAENGVGKFSDFNDRALDGIAELGITHIWYTGIPHHAVIGDYSAFGISDDDPDVVKGRAGSPYAVKDYYNVNPDLADDVSKRLEEFEALINRTHDHGMKVIMDIVPNHVARNYHSISAPEGVEDFGESDDTNVEYNVDNNFYYVVGEAFQAPDIPEDYKPLGGENHPMSDGQFDESPAKWTGNGSRSPKPHYNDWYETVKINYGVRPDGSYDFPTLPEGFESKSYKEHLEFWSDKKLPNSWYKYRDIALYWTKKGVDGFRFDVAEMVPFEFWSFMNSSIKNENPDAFLLAEIYNPSIYRDYIHLGKMDYLYDKVELYDTLKNIMQGKGSTFNITAIQDGQKDIDGHFLHFLENHDEQRIASPQFAGNAEAGKPAMVVSTLISSSPVMIYFGQEVGEDADEDAGFGDPSRTSIFDYVGVPAHQRWMNEGKFDGGQLSEKEKDLRNFYVKLLNFASVNSVVKGEFVSLQEVNESTENYNSKLYSFARTTSNESIIVVSNFDAENSYEFELKLDKDFVSKMNLEDGEYTVKDYLSEKYYQLKVSKGHGSIALKIKALGSYILML
jgi:glycosidase